VGVSRFLKHSQKNPKCTYVHSQGYNSFFCVSDVPLGGPSSVRICLIRAQVRTTVGVALVVDWVVSRVFLFGEFSQPGDPKKNGWRISATWWQKERAGEFNKGIF
jgi:hypothetical protein